MPTSPNQLTIRLRLLQLQMLFDAFLKMRASPQRNTGMCVCMIYVGQIWLTVQLINNFIHPLHID